ncbi:hypothetical protein [Streptomyces sp. NPDC012508]|uniref:hypothetical protein n=1 Tax=Streptomyces sp. NPDC012508 TaxID=3364837 RepID=UPI0036A26305
MWVVAAFGGEAGGRPQQFGEVSGSEIRGTDVAPITIEIDDDLESWSAETSYREALS